MARPASRHGRYDAKVRFTSVDVDQSSPANLGYHARDTIHVGYSEHVPPNSWSRKGPTLNDQYPTSPSPAEGGPVHYSQEEEVRPRSRRNTKASQQFSLPLDNMENHHRPWSSGSDEGYVPSPPPRPPSVQRPRPQSSRKRPTSSRMSHPSPVQDELPDVTVMRPTSSFNKFRPLPSIGNQGPSVTDTHSITSEMGDLHLASSASMTIQSQDSDRALNKESQKESDKSLNTVKRKSTDITTSPTSTLKYFNGPHPLPPEPSEQEERLLLAVKLPTNGKRYHRYFSPEDYLQDIHHFAENTSQENLTEYVLACNAPRKVFSNLTQRICDVGLQDKTVLYFEERSDT